MAASKMPQCESWDRSLPSSGSSAVDVNPLDNAAGWFKPQQSCHAGTSPSLRHCEADGEVVRYESDFSRIPKIPPRPARSTSRSPGHLPEEFIFP